jgi:putative DNA primase/helicase
VTDLDRDTWGRLLDQLDDPPIGTVAEGLADARDLDVLDAYDVVEEAIDEGELLEEDTGAAFGAVRLPDGEDESPESRNSEDMEPRGADTSADDPQGKEAETYLADGLAAPSGREFYPEALAARDWWVNWVLAYRWDDDDREGKATKQPVAPYDTGDAEPVSWSFDLPEEEHPSNELDTVRPWAGTKTGLEIEAPDRVISDVLDTGIILPRGQSQTEDDTVLLIDWDDVRDPETGEIHPVVAEALRVCDGYAEISQSGEGIHQFVFGEVPGTQRVFIRHIDEEPFIGDDLPAVEMYQSGRLCAMTGRHIDGSGEDVAEGQDMVDRLCWRFGTANNAGPGTPTDPFADEREGSSDDTPDHDEVAEAIDNAAAFEDEDPTEWEYPDEWSLRYAAIVRARSRGDEFSGVPNWQLNGYAAAAGYADDLGKEEVLSHLNEVCDDDDLQREVEQMWRKAEGSDHEPPAYETLAKRGILPERYAAGGATPYGSADTKDEPGPSETTDKAAADGGSGAGRKSKPLNPDTVLAWAGLGEDASVSDLDDRQRAAVVWDLILQSDEFHIRVRRDSGGLLSYDRGVWSSEGERTLRHAARQALGSMNYGANVLTELKAQARSDPRVEVEGDELGVDPGYVAVENGLLDLRAASNGDEDAIRDLRPDDLALQRLPVHYDPDATAPEWAGLVEEWAETGRAEALQEYVGYALHAGGMPIHRALLLVGSGANGKGTFLHVVRKLLGEDNTTSIELQTLANEKDALAQFHGSIANIDDDLSARQIGAGLGMFKKLTGGDHVRARQLYEEGFEFQATGKHLYAANKVPEVEVPDDDEAFWRRWLLVEFPNHYPPSERDHELRDRLSTPEALSGVLNWAIEGWARLLDAGKFTGEETSAHQKRQRWQRWGESVSEFISECVERDEDADRVTTSEAHERFTAWCRENGKDRASQQNLTNKLKTENVGYKPSIRIDGRSTRGYDALGFTDEVPDVEELQDEDDEDDDDGSRQASL